MKWVGLTGGIATGKSTVTDLLRQLGYNVIDADVVAREVVAPGSSGLKSVVSEFGTAVLGMDGSLDRKKLGTLVFSNVLKRKKLESILHPLIQQRVQILKNEIVQKGATLAFYDVPLLFESELESQFDFTIVVSADSELQINRLMQRDHLDEQHAVQRIKAQMPISEKIKRASFVIHNNSNLSDLKAQLEQVLEKIKNQS